MADETEMVPLADVVAMAAAIREALAPPLPAVGHWAEYARLLCSRAAYTVGVLGALADGRGDVASSTHVLSGMSEACPVAYPVAAEPVVEVVPGA